MADAEKYATEDAKRKESAEAKNLAETMIYTTEKMVKENDAKIKEEDKKETSDKIQLTKEALKSENLEEIKKAVDELSKVAQRVGASLYEAEKAEKTADQPKTEETKAEEVKPEEEKK